MTATLLPNAKQNFVDGNGVPLASGTVQFYVPNTATPKNTWQDSGQTILNTNPVTLDAAGRGVMYGNGQYRQVVKDALGNLVWDQVTASTAPGATFVSAADFGAVGDNATDNSPAAALAASWVNTTGGFVVWPQGSYVFNSAIPSITSTGGGFLGSGCGNNCELSQTLAAPYGTVFRANFASGNTLTLNAARQFLLSDISFWPLAYRTGSEIFVAGNASQIILNRPKFSFCDVPLTISVAGQTAVYDPFFFNNFGIADILIGGTSNGGVTGLGAQGTIIMNPTMQTAWQGAIPAVSGTGKVYTSWASGRTQAQYDILAANGWIWQTPNGGTTALSGSGPAAPTFTSASGSGSPLGSSVTDGTVHWVPITKATHAGILIDSFSVGTWIDTAQMEAGFYGLRMTDSQPSSLSKPQYTTVSRCLTNSTVGAGYAFDGGWIVEMDDCVANFSASLAGLTVGAGSAFAGALTVLGGRYSQNATQGIYISTGSQYKIQGAQIGANSQLTAGNFDDLTFDGAITDFDVQGNTFAVPDNSQSVSNAINITSSSANRFIVMGNRTNGNAITNAAGTGATKIVQNNI